MRQLLCLGRATREEQPATLSRPKKASLFLFLGQISHSTTNKQEFTENDNNDLKLS
jgi:hypothetical protein